MPTATSIRIRFLSQGSVETGGYRHEKKLAFFLQQYLQSEGQNVELSESRYNGHVFSLSGYLKLLLWFYRQATGTVNIVPLRGALSAILKSTVYRTKTIIVLHSEVQPYSSFLLRLNHKLLVGYLKTVNPSHIAVVTIAQFWKQTFEAEGMPSESIHIVPNLFDPKDFTPFITSVKQKQVHLGLDEPKTDKAIYALAGRLSAQGYYCYFSTLNPSKQKKCKDYDVLYFSEYEKYLTMMAQSEFTIQFPVINEGWSRIAHESILVGTKVIGLAKGGLAELLGESGSIVVEDIDGFERAVIQQQPVGDNNLFVQKYSESNAAYWLDSLLRFCRA